MSLLNKAVRLAYSKPHLRGILLPLLKTAEAAVGEESTGGTGAVGGAFIEFMKEVGKTKVKNPDTENTVQISSLKGPLGKKLVHKEFERWLKEREKKEKGTAKGKTLTKDPKGKTPKPKSETPSKSRGDSLTLEQVKDSAESLQKVSTEVLRGSANRIGKNQKDLTKSELAVLSSISLFSNGDISSVLDPAKFKKSPRRVVGPLFEDASRLSVDPSRKAYQEANKVCLHLAASPVKKGSVPDQHRGMFLSADMLQKLETVGESFPLRPITSFSSDKEVATEFAQQVHSKTKDDSLLPVVFTMKSNAIQRGTDISKLSYYPDEAEFLTSGSLRVLSARRGADGVMYIDCEQGE